MAGADVGGDDDAVVLVLAVENFGAVFEVGEGFAVGLGQVKIEGLQSAMKVAANAFDKLIDVEAGDGRQGQGFGVFFLKNQKVGVVFDFVDFIEKQKPGLLVGADVF